MELLVVTLAYTTPGRDADVLSRIRLISENVRSAPGLVTSRFYRSRGSDSFYLMLTTWENEESWRRAQERYNPKSLLLGSATEILTAAPQQWLMHYLWGYSRPAATPIVAAAHLTTVRPDQAEIAQQGCIKGLRQQALQPMLAFAFLARGIHEENLPTWAGGQAPAEPRGNPAQWAGNVNHGPTVKPSPTGTHTPTEAPYLHGPVFLNLFSWAGERDREEFYADPHYRAINNFISSLGAVHSLPLEPM